MRYGLASRCARVRAAEVAVLDLEKDGSDARDRIEAEIEAAKREERAEAIVLGCAGMADLAADLSARHALPVVDGVAAAVVLIEALARLGLRTSKLGGYAPPLPKLDPRLLGPVSTRSPVLLRARARVKIPRSSAGFAGATVLGEISEGAKPPSERLSAGQLDLEALGAKPLGHALAVVALDLDGAVLDGAARAAEPLEVGGARLEPRPAGREDRGPPSPSCRLDPPRSRKILTTPSSGRSPGRGAAARAAPDRPPRSGAPPPSVEYTRRVFFTAAV